MGTSVIDSTPTCPLTLTFIKIKVESSVKVKVQLRRPSDGAVSESREFELLPLDAGRSYFSAKRLKTNYTVFNQVRYKLNRTDGILCLPKI